MNKYRKLGLTFLAGISALTLSASSFAAPEKPYNAIVFFGDSLTDNGNLYRFTLGALPKSPPYLQGRFSNGNTWAEKVADHFLKTDKIISANYAVGGSSTIFHNPLEGFLPYTLLSEVDDYFFRNTFYDKAHTLFSIWIGANDYLPQKTFSLEMVQHVIATQKDVIERLIQNGGKNFLVVNLPDLTRTPRISGSDIKNVLGQYTVTHNTLLAEMVDNIKKTYPNVRVALYDVNQIFTALIENPDKFNQQYHVHITDTATACWNGGYTVKQGQLTQTIEANLKSEMLNMPAGATLDTQALAQSIANNPDLAETYAVGQQYAKGGSVCANPNDHLFWDTIHPTEVTHTVLSESFIRFIDENFAS